MDERGYGHTPILITWDVTQHKLREFFRFEFPYAEWMIYSPQRAIERLSMVNFDASNLAMKDSVLAILDEDYTKDSSLIDVLSGFFGNDTLETESIISVISKVSGRLHNESHDNQDFELNERSVISEALLTIQNSFRDKFAEVRRLFSDSEKEESVIEILANFSSEKINQEQLTSAFNELLNSLDSSNE